MEFPNNLPLYSATQAEDKFAINQIKIEK